MGSLAVSPLPVQQQETYRCVEWRKSLTFWLSAEAVTKMRERLSRKKPLMFEVTISLN